MSVEALVQTVRDAGPTLRVSAPGNPEVTPSGRLTPKLRSHLAEHRAVITATPLTCPTVMQLYLTAEQVELATRWAAVLEVLNAKEFAVFIERHTVLRASVREVLWRVAVRARDNQREGTPRSSTDQRPDAVPVLGSPDPTP